MSALPSTDADPVGRRHGLHPTVNVTNRSKKEDFILTEEEVPPHLERELEAFYRFLTVKFYDQQERRVAPVTTMTQPPHHAVTHLCPV